MHEKLNFNVLYYNCPMLSYEFTLDADPTENVYICQCVHFHGFLSVQSSQSIASSF